MPGILNATTQFSGAYTVMGKRTDVVRVLPKLEDANPANRFLATGFFPSNGSKADDDFVRYTVFTGEDVARFRDARGLMAHYDNLMAKFRKKLVLPLDKTGFELMERMLAYSDKIRHKLLPAPWADYVIGEWPNRGGFAQQIEVALDKGNFNAETGDFLDFHTSDRDDR